MFKILLSFFLMCMMMGCSPQEGSIQPIAYSSKIPQPILSYDGPMALYTIRPPSQAKSYQIHFWQLQNGQWVDEVALEGSTQEKDFVVRVQSDVVQVLCYTRVGSAAVNLGFIKQEEMCMDTYELETDRTIQIKEEIPLWVQIYTKDNSLNTKENFLDLKGDAGFAITYEALDVPISD